MIILKTAILLIILVFSFIIGNLVSRKYINRVNDLKEIKNALNMFKTKIKFTYEPIPEIFYDISKNLKPNISEIFKKSSIDMNNNIMAGEAWKQAISSANTNLSEEDINIVQGLSKLLGQTDIDGQLSEIELTNSFLNTQIKKAEIEQEKNVKLYKTLGLTIGLTVVILLI